MTLALSAEAFGVSTEFSLELTVIIVDQLWVVKRTITTERFDFAYSDCEHSA